MRAVACVLLIVACGRTDPAAPVIANAPPTLRPATAAPPRGPACAAGVPAAACIGPGVHACGSGGGTRIGEWRYALVASSFEVTQDLAGDALVAAWRAGTIAATAETAEVLAPALGVRGAEARLAPGAAPILDATHWAIVPAHELSPAWSVISIEGQHPLTGGAGPLVVALCGTAAAPVRNIDPARLTTLVMSGTTALTGRTAERIDTNGIADTIRYIRPFFAGADLVHVSNEVAFVKGCKPRTGQKELIFCARDRYIELLEALHTKLIELTGSHLVDYGEHSLERTIDMYEQRGWTWFGGGRTQLDATTPRIVEDHGNRLAFVGCNAVNWWIKAIRQGPGTANCDWPRMAWQIQDLRRRGFTPIATVQHRELRTHAPPPDLVRDLRGLAEAGAAFVLGSQAHVAHPWDMHYGAYVHYGPGNILFAQYRDEQRDATVDKLYIHAGRLLTVAHIFTRTEHGQPRLLTDRERTQFLGKLSIAAAAIAPPDPTAVPVLPSLGRIRPDSVVIRGVSQRLTVTVPEHLADNARYPLVVDLAATSPARADAFVVVTVGKLVASGEEIAAFMRAKYPIASVTITPGAAPEVRPKRRRTIALRTKRS